MIPRYQTKTMQAIFCDESKYKTWLLVEMAHLEAYLEHKKVPDDGLMDRLITRAQKIDWHKFIDEVEHHEQDTRHDVIAFLQTLEDTFGKDARLIHVGLTSSDIVDTAQAVLIGQASKELEHKLKHLITVLWRQAQKYRGVACLGRTHGQGAEPMTFGVKILSHLTELMRGYERLSLAKEACLVGKLSGAVGVYALTPPAIEQQALKKLGLKPEVVATQVVARDRHAALFSAMAVLAGSIERLAVEIRLLMHGQVKEISEPFFSKQKGSSAMPHKKNPILSENLTGLMRLVRAYAQASLENQALWHERDISHSSVERVIIPDLFHVMDFALSRLTNLMANLVVDETRMKKNLEAAGDGLQSQAVMLALIEKGLMRKAAYELVQTAALSGQKSFKDALTDAGISEHLSQEELIKIFSDTDTMRHEEVLFDRVACLMNEK